MDNEKLVVLDDRRSCSCDGCTLPCRYGPEFLGLGDAERMHAAHQPDRPFDEWAKEYLIEGEPLVIRTEMNIRNALPVVTPQLGEDGVCKFYVNGSCAVYTVRPTGCRHYSMHVSPARRVALMAEETYRRLTADKKAEEAQEALMFKIPSAGEDGRKERQEECRTKVWPSLNVSLPQVTFLDAHAASVNMRLVEMAVTESFVSDAAATYAEISSSDEDQEEIEDRIDRETKRLQPFIAASVKAVALRVVGANMHAADLKTKYGQIWTTDELKEEFEVRAIPNYPFLAVRRHDDGRCGIMLFQHLPRFYFAFFEDPFVEQMFDED